MTNTNPMTNYDRYIKTVNNRERKKALREMMDSLRKESSKIEYKRGIDSVDRWINNYK